MVKLTDSGLGWCSGSGLGLGWVQDGLGFGHLLTTKQNLTWPNQPQILFSPSKPCKASSPFLAKKASNAYLT